MDAATLIAGIRARGIASTEISDADLTTLMTYLLTDYSVHRPIYAIKVFETIEDQQVYTWTDIGDSAGIDLVECIWNSFGQVTEDWSALLGAIGINIDIDADYHTPSQAIVEDLKRLNWSRHNAGTGRQIQPHGSVYLDPTPTQSGTSVLVLYTKKYTALTQIDAMDIDIFLDLVHSRIADRIVMTLSASAVAMRLKTPEYEIAVGEQVGVWRKVATEKWASFIQRCNAGQAAVGRS